MSKKPSQSLNIRGSHLSNVQIGGQAGKDQDINQTQSIIEDVSKDSLTSTEVVELILEIEELFHNSDLSDSNKKKAIRHLKSANEVAQEEKPDKEFVAKSLLRATKVLEEAENTIDAGTSLWNKVKPIILRLSPWLGVAASFFV